MNIVLRIRSPSFVASVEKYIFQYAPVILPDPLGVRVEVAGVNHTVQVLPHNESGDNNVDIILSESATDSKVWDLASILPENRGKVRVLVGGIKPEIPESLPRTSWCRELEPGWLESMVRQHVAIKEESTIFETQMAEFREYIEVIRQDVQNVSRVVHENYPLGFTYGITGSAMLAAARERKHPIFRRMFQEAYGLGSPYHRKHGKVLRLGEKEVTVYFMKDINGGT